MNAVAMAAVAAAINSYNPLLLSAGDPAKISVFANDLRACGYVVSTRHWANGDIVPKPVSLGPDAMVALSDKPLSPTDRRLPCFFKAERRAFAR